MKVPFLDLKAQYETIRDDIADAMQQVIDNTAFAGGPFVAQFEKEFASFCNCQYAIRVKNRDALITTLAEKDIHCGIHYPVPIHLQARIPHIEIESGFLTRPKVLNYKGNHLLKR